MQLQALAGLYFKMLFHREKTRSLETNKQTKNNKQTTTKIDKKKKGNEKKKTTNQTKPNTVNK